MFTNRNRPVVASSGTSGAPWAIVRFLQFASAVLVMSLIAYALHNYNYFGSKKANFGLAVGVIGTFYILCVILFVAVLPQLVLVGPYLIAEGIMCLLWLCGFIVTAKVFGQHSCGSTRNINNYNPNYGSMNAFQNSQGQVNPFTNRYTSSSHKTACRSAKTSIAFSGLSFVLFVLSCVVLGLNVVKPIIAAHGGPGIWKTGGYLGTRLHRWSGLGLTQSVGGVQQQQTYGPTDLEQQEAAAGTTTTATGGGIHEQRTMSSGESAKSESPVVGEPKYTQADGAAGMT